LKINNKGSISKYITSGQSNLTTHRIAATHGWFSGIRQVVPVCSPPNTHFLGSTQVQIPNSISTDFAQLMAESLYFTTGRSFPLYNCLLPWGISIPI